MDLMPLFIQNNYLGFVPAVTYNADNHEVMEAECMYKTSLAADDIRMGDVGSTTMRGFMDFSLLPVLSVVSCISPGAIMAGGKSGAPNFPSWLGNYSSRNKSYRQLNELKRVMSIDAHCNARELALEYLPVLRSKLLQALRRGEEGFDEVGEILNDYGLNRDDMNSVLEMGEVFSEQKFDGLLDTRTKTKLTKKINKETVAKVARHDKKAKLSKAKSLKVCFTRVHCIVCVWYGMVWCAVYAHIRIRIHAHTASPPDAGGRQRG
jgi:replication factor C subunit 1